MPKVPSERVADLFKSALDHDAREWTAFLESACPDDGDLRAEVRSLLTHHRASPSLLETPAIHLEAENFAGEEPDRVGEVIGDYEILSLLGRGGMGDVYLARDHKLGREVALKLIGSFGGRNLIRQLHREERILAALSHPNIARLYGSATTAQGEPCFIMEYIGGERLDDYCRRNYLTIPQRLELFRKVCAAVAYAHQHLVIHRDLKPANVRVTPEGEPKLLDFGIAKLLDADDGGQRLNPTITFALVMTPDYASPEQVRGETMTTSSDVYSLGVVLYELLTGAKPYRLTSRSHNEIARAITDLEPVRPSGSCASQNGSNARNRRLLRGDIDKIVLKAMRKEPARRYQSVAHFSEDIRRHLDGLPVSARKDTWRYRSAKFVRRNRIGVAAVALVFFSLLAGVVATTREARATRQEKARAESINAFLGQMLNYSNPIPDLARDNSHPTTMSEALDAAAQRLESGAFADQPEVRAGLEKIISDGYGGQGKRQLADEHLQKYLALVSRLYGKDHPKTLAATATRAALLFNAGKMEEAEKIFRQNLPRMRAEQQKGNIRTDILADEINNLACLRRTQGDSHEAELLFRESLSLKSQMPKEARFLIGVTRSTLASTLADQGKFEEALRTAQEAVAEGRENPTETPGFGYSLTVLGGFLVDKGNFPEGDAVLRDAEGIFRKLLAPSALWLGDNLRNQAISFYQQNRFAEAQSKIDETLKIYRAGFGPHYDHYPTVLITQGLLWNKTGKTKEAEAILREALKLRTDLLPKEHFWIAVAEGALGECLMTQERFAEAKPLVAESYAALKSRLGLDDPRTREASRRLETLSGLLQKR